MQTAGEILSTAADIVTGSRNATHGEMSDTFARVARLWQAYMLNRNSAKPLDAEDVALMMALLKMARAGSGKLNVDDYVDLAGYAGCAGEIAQKSSKE